MSVLNKLKGLFIRNDVAFSDNQNGGFIQFFNAINGGSVAVVTPQTALCITAIYSCNEFICDTCSLISPKIYKYDLLGKQLDRTHDQNYLLTKEPNSYTSNVEFDKIWTMSYNIWGNGYAEIIRNKYGRPIEYVNLLPWEVKVLFKDGEKYYLYKNGTNAERVISAKDMLHLAKPSFDNRTAADSPITLNAKSINSGLSIHQYGDDMYSNGVQLSGYIYGDKPLDASGREVLRSSFESKYKEKKGQVGILPHGFKYEQLKYNLPMADANIIQAKKLSVEDISRIYRVPLALLNATETADNKSEIMYNIFLSTCIAPIQLLKAAELNRKIFRPKEKLTHYVKYELKGLYRTSMQERYEAHRIAINAGFMNPDEVREIEDMNPTIDGTGKEYMKPLNSIPASMWNKFYENQITQNSKNGNT